MVTKPIRPSAGLPNKRLRKKLYDKIDLFHEERSKRCLYSKMLTGSGYCSCEVKYMVFVKLFKFF